MIPYGGWPIAYDDIDIEVRRDPQDPEEHGIFIKKIKKLMLLPRGVLKEIATENRKHGEGIIERHLGWAKISLEDISLTSDTLIAAATKAYINEEKRRGNLL